MDSEPEAPHASDLTADADTAASTSISVHQRFHVPDRMTPSSSYGIGSVSMCVFYRTGEWSTSPAIDPPGRPYHPAATH